MKPVKCKISKAIKSTKITVDAYPCSLFLACSSQHLEHLARILGDSALGSPPNEPRLPVSLVALLWRKGRYPSERSKEGGRAGRRRTGSYRREYNG